MNYEDKLRVLNFHGSVRYDMNLFKNDYPVNASFYTSDGRRLYTPGYGKSEKRAAEMLFSIVRDMLWERCLEVEQEGNEVYDYGGKAQSA